MLARATHPRPDFARPAARRGATIVEAAVVLPIFLMFVFGVFEYGRYILVLHVTTNAAREGARQAVVRANSPEAATFSEVSPAPFGNARPAYRVPFIEAYVRDRMGGVNGMISGFEVRVFPCDTDQLYATPCVVTAMEPGAFTPAKARAWNNAAFSERIAVQVVGEYRPILPSFLLMSSVVPVNTVALMGSEG